MRSAWLNFKNDQIVSGASTITQQVARNLILSEDERFEQTYTRKIREALLALQLTRKYSKDEILALYLNQMYYGGMSYGVEAASQTYFGKPAKELVLAECALLAGLPQAPSYYDPYTKTEEVLARQKVVLRLMEKEKFISSTERSDAENFAFHFNPSPYPIHAPHFVWMVKHQVDELYESGIVHKEQSIIVRTTLDLAYQEIAENSITHQINKYVNNAALVVIEPTSGEILAMVGSMDYFDASINGAVNMATSPRQTGSALKPFIYALALDPNSDVPWTAATPLLDVATTFSIRDGKAYTPVNYDQLEHGIVPLRDALGSSLNIPAVLTLEKVGLEDTVEFLKRLGVSSIIDPNNYDLSLALGGGQISLLEMTNGYSTFASGGYYYENRFILDIKTPEGDILYETEESVPEKVIDARIAWLISDILSDDIAREIGFGLNSTLKIDRPAAVKTGTTTNFHDNWTIGYTPDLVVGVWVGNSNFEAMHDVTGLTGAAPIWHETIRTLLQGKPEQEFEQPEGIVQADVCSLSGLLPTSACQKVQKEWFLEETVPTDFDDIYKEVEIDSMTGSLANEFTPVERKEKMVVYDVPEEAKKWARNQGWMLLSDLSESYESVEEDSMIELISPAPKTTFRIDPNFDLASQQILVEARTDDLIQEVSFWVDGQLIDTIDDGVYQIWWQLAAGEHLFWAEGVSVDGEKYSTNTVIVTVIAN
jgi:penicillin-binding protein 1C